jgi:uncharacterized protein YlxW (UPF0749 family)
MAGLLFAANAQLASTDDRGRQPQNFADLVQAESGRVDRLSGQIEELNSSIDALQREAGGTSREDAEITQIEGIDIGAIPVTGPGLRVEMEDAPVSSASLPGVTPDDLVIHQQDLQHVINALWAGGAEAMTLMGERVTMTSAFRCVGNVLHLHGRVFSPPFIVEAIGDPDRLEAAIDASPGVQTFRDYADWLGLGLTVETVTAIDMPAYSGATGLQYAQLPQDVSPLRRRTS